MQGYKTLAVNLLALAAVWFGVPEDALRAWAGELVTFLAAVNVALRFVTKGPVAGGRLDLAIDALKTWLDRGTSIKALALLGVLPLLGACAGALPGNPQGYVGITDARVETGLAKEGEKPYVKEVRFRDGKEKQSVEITVKFEGEKPTITYTAQGVKAFDGQKLRAAVEQAVSDDVKAAAPGIVESVVGAVAKALGVP